MHIEMRMRNSPQRNIEETEGGRLPDRGATPDGGAAREDSQRRSSSARYDQRPAVSLRTTVNYMDAAEGYRNPHLE